MTKPLDDEVFAIAFVIAKQCLDRKILLDDDRFPALGTDFSLDNDFKTADQRL